MFAATASLLVAFALYHKWWQQEIKRQTDEENEVIIKRDVNDPFTIINFPSFSACCRNYSCWTFSLHVHDNTTSRYIGVYYTHKSHTHEQLCNKMTLVLLCYCGMMTMIL